MKHLFLESTSGVSPANTATPACTTIHVVKSTVSEDTETYPKALGMNLTTEVLQITPSYTPNSRSSAIRKSHFTSSTSCCRCRGGCCSCRHCWRLRSSSTHCLGRRINHSLTFSISGDSLQPNSKL